MMRKGQLITVRAPGGKGVQCTLVDVDYKDNKIWVRLPTQKIMIMNFDKKKNVYVGSSARLEFTVDPQEN